MVALTRHWVWTGLGVLVAGIGLFGLGIAAYLGHVQASATALIKSAREMRTTVDAEREIAAWRKRAGKEFWVESSSSATERTYSAQIVNAIADLGFVELTKITLDVTMHDGKLRRIKVIEWTASYPLVSVSIQEWFDAGLPAGMALPNRFSVGQIAGPAEAAVAVVFPSSLPDVQRAKAFAFNTKCLVRPRLCKTAEDILPGVWQLEPVVGPGKLGNRQGQVLGGTFPVSRRIGHIGALAQRSDAECYVNTRGNNLRRTGV